MKTAMVVFASEQLWPNLSGLLHWHRHDGGLAALYIYHSEDAVRSRAPAERLRRLCAKLFPTVEAVDLDRTQGGITPELTRSCIQAWRAERPADWRWVVNATGGLKLMFAGAMSLVGSANCEVVYRELSGDWYRFTPDPNAGGMRATGFAIAPEETDAIPVVDLVEMQFDPPDGATWTHTAAQPLPMPALTEALVRHSGRWDQSFRDVGLNGGHPAGTLFEQYMAACLLAFGVARCELNLELHAGTGTSLNEIDVVANHHGRLLILDCKLTTDDGGADPALTDQIARAAELQRRLGGLAAQCVLVRPNRRLEPAHREYALASRLRVVDQSDSPRLFARLAEVLGLELTDQLRKCDAILERACCAGQPVFSRPPGLLAYSPRTKRAALPPAVWNIENLGREYASSSRQDWFCCWWGNQVRLVWYPRNPKTIEPSLASFCQLWAAKKVPVEHEVSSTRRTVYLTFTEARAPGILRTIKDYLATRRGRGLVDG